MKRWISFLLVIMLVLLVLPTSVFANSDIIGRGICGDNLTWTLTEGGTLTISGTGEMTDYGLLDELDQSDYDPTWTGEGYHYIDIKKVVIKKGVTNITHFAFSSCDTLKSVTIPSTVKWIGDCAFADCYDLQSITIPSSVERIGESAFDTCISLKSVKIPSSVKKIGDGAFSRCDSLTDVTISKGLKHIGAFMFNECAKLKNVTIPSSVESIGEYAFMYCTALEKITIPSSVKSIDYSAFSNCDRLKTITLPASVKRIKESTFYGSNALKTVIYNGSSADWKKVVIEDYNDSLRRANKIFNGKSISGVKVSGFKAATADYNKVKLSWNKVSNADGYLIYRSTQKNSGYSAIKTITSASTTSFTNSGLTAGKTYYYKIRPYVNANNGKKLGSDSSVVSAKPAIGTVSNFTASATAYNKIKLLWKQAKYADGYLIYRSTKKTGGFKAIKTITSGSTLSYTNTGLATGTTYYYKVCPYVNTNNGKKLGSYSSVVSAKPAIGTVSNFTASATAYNKIKLTWKKVSGADGYLIYRSTKKTGEFKAIKTITSGSTLSYTNTGLVTGTTYYYKVRPYVNVNDSKNLGSYSLTVSAKPVLGKVNGVKSVGYTYNKAKVTWSQVSGASGYEVYRALSKTGKYKRVNTVSGGKTLSYIDTGLTTGTGYYYKVRAYRNVNNKKVYGTLSAYDGAKPIVAKPKNLKVAKNSNGYPKLTWNKVSGANGYQIYRAATQNGTYTKVGTTTKNASVTFTDKTAKTNKSYYYKVRAYRKVGDKNVYGNYTNSVVYAGINSLSIKKLESMHAAGQKIDATRYANKFTYNKGYFIASNGCTWYAISRYTEVNGDNNVLRFATKAGNANNWINSINKDYFKVYSSSTETIKGNALAISTAKDSGLGLGKDAGGSWVAASENHVAYIEGVKDGYVYFSQGAYGNAVKSFGYINRVPVGKFIKDYEYIIVAK